MHPGIGCYFDDPMHAMWLQDAKSPRQHEVLRLQSVYGFTVGGGVEDTRLRTLKAYTDVA